MAVFPASQRVYLYISALFKRFLLAAKMMWHMLFPSYGALGGPLVPACFHLRLPGHNPSLRKVRAGTQSRGGNHEGKTLAYLLVLDLLIVLM